MVKVERPLHWQTYPSTLALRFATRRGSGMGRSMLQTHRDQGKRGGVVLAPLKDAGVW